MEKCKFGFLLRTTSANARQRPPAKYGGRTPAPVHRLGKFNSVGYNCSQINS